MLDFLLKKQSHMVQTGADLAPLCSPVAGFQFSDGGLHAVYRLKAKKRLQFGLA